MVIVTYHGDGKILFNPRTPAEALLLAESHCRSVGFPHLAPMTVIRRLTDGHDECIAGLFSGTKLTMKEILPGLRLRVGSSEIEIVRVRPTEREVTYKTHNKLVKIDSQRFIDLANQQGFRKVWDLKTFLTTLKGLLKPILSAVPLMWVLSLVSNAVRKRPIKYENLIPTRDDEGRLSATPILHHSDHKHDEHTYHQHSYDHHK